MKHLIVRGLTVLGLLAVLASCYSLIESAVGGVAAAETEEAISEPGRLEITISSGPRSTRSITTRGAQPV